MTAFKIISADETNEIMGNSIHAGRGRYPWRQLKLGESFFVMRSQCSREDFRPGIPPSVTSQGLKFKTFKTTREGIQGILVVRTA
jgi:hypothetical protein